MTKDFHARFSAVVLALITVAAIVYAYLNVSKEREFPAVYDGVWWVEQDCRPVAGPQEQQCQISAQGVDAEGPGAKAGIKTGDVLQAVNDREVNTAAQVERQKYGTGVWRTATYSLVRRGVEINVPVILAPDDRRMYSGLRFIGLIYLGIGLYVLLRRWTAPKSTHFYLFCLTSFIFYSYHFTGRLRHSDLVVYWANVVAWLLQPALFLHFVLTFPEAKEFLRKRRWFVPLLYLPAVLLFTIHLLAYKLLAPTGRLLWGLDRVHMSYLAVYFIAAAAVLWGNYRHAKSLIQRQQLKWVTRGTILAIAPFILFYAIPFITGTLANTAMKISVLSLVFLPLTFGYAIFRYRLMDVDVIFKRGMAYTLATATIAGLYFAAVGIAAQIIQKGVPSAGTAGLIAAIIVTALLFEPVKNWINVRLDKFFYRKRYDYRRTLVEFGRELSSEPHLDKMLSSIVDRLTRTLLVERMAIFMAGVENPEAFTLAKSFGMSDTGGLDLSFLCADRPEAEAGHLFFDNTRQVVRETPTAQQTIARLDLNYFIPCRLQERTIAVLGLGKTTEGDFLSTEDVELLETLSGYIAIAIQNARLYASLEQKATEYERLKDFNENIVESISVGVFAVDLADRIEFWNSQMEVMYALPRWQAVGRPLSEIFPPAFAEEFYRVRQNPGIHNLYKFRLSTPAGEHRVCNVAFAPLVTRKFQVVGRLIILDDITERIELESQLSQAEKMSSIGLLAAGVAHEVNTPLAVISSYAQLLTKQIQGDSKKSELLDKITQQTFRASEIVNNLLNFSRTSGTEFSEVSINKIIKETLVLLEHQLKTSRVKVEDRLDTNLPLIQGNAGKLQQVFLNLFLNAKDAMAGGGILRVVTSNGSGVNVTVSDTGSGIAQEHIQRIYDPFFTTKNSPRDGRRGTGLGLSVTYGIIQEHAGKIRVESRVGEGTTFYLEFPLMKKAVNV